MPVNDQFFKRYEIDDELEFAFEQMTEYKVYQKGEIIFSPGSYLKHIFFVEEGYTRIFYHKDERDITHYFFGPGRFSTGIESVFYGKPSIFGFQAITMARVARIPFDAIKQLADTNIQTAKIIQSVLLENLIEFSNRFYRTQFQSAEQRYLNLLAHHPDLLQHVPLGYIASFLGISQQTLSVIRAGLS